MPDWRGRVFGGLLSGMMLSAVIHAGTFGGLYLWFARRNRFPIVAELDLSTVSLLPVPSDTIGRRRTQPPEEWFLPPKRKKAPAPLPVTPKTEKKPPADEEEESPLGEEQDFYAPISKVARKPRWTGNLISSKDYPRVARERGADGRVVLQVFINERGRVMDVHLLQGANETLNEAALRKIKEAEFAPALDERGDPVACQVTLPIRFELK